MVMPDQAKTSPNPSGDPEVSAPAPAAAGAGPSTTLRTGPSTELRAGWLVVAALALTGLAVLGGLWLRECNRFGQAPAPETLRLRFDLNKASAAELDGLPGIGATRAARLVEERKVRGGFKSLIELDDPALLGPGASERLAPYVLPLPGDGDAGRR